MSRRRLRTLALWLLPILAARALLPVGFMLAFQSGALDLQFCPTQSPGIVAMLEERTAAGNAHVHHEQAPVDPSAGSSIEAPCAYGIAALAISVDVPYLADGAPPRFDFSREPTSSFNAGIGPARADRIRGPPLVS